MLRKLLTWVSVVALFGFAFADSGDKGNAVPIVELTAVVDGR
jgi:hypothetical protein